MTELRHTVSLPPTLCSTCAAWFLRTSSDSSWVTIRCAELTTYNNKAIIEIRHNPSLVLPPIEFVLPSGEYMAVVLTSPVWVSEGGWSPKKFCWLHVQICSFWHKTEIWSLNFHPRCPVILTKINFIRGRMGAKSLDWGAVSLHAPPLRTAPVSIHPLTSPIPGHYVQTCQPHTEKCFIY